MMVFISNGKLHVSAYSGHLQAFTTFLLRVLYNKLNLTKARKIVMRSQHHHAV